MMSGSVIFTYKRRRFSNKPQIIDELQSDPSVKTPVIESKLQIEPQKLAELQSDPLPQPPIGDCFKEVKPQIESQNVDESQIEPEKLDKLRSDSSDKSPIGASFNESKDSKPERKDESQSDPLDEPLTVDSFNESNFQIEPQKMDEMQSDPSNMPSIGACYNESKEPKIQFEPQKMDEPHSNTFSASNLEVEMQPSSKQLKGEIMDVKGGEDSARGALVNPNIKEQEKTIIVPQSDLNETVPVLPLPIEETHLDCKKDKFTPKSSENRTEIDLTKPAKEMETEMEIETKNFPEKEREMELEWLNSLDRDLKGKKKEFKGQSVKIDMGLSSHESPFCADLLSLRPNFDQEISSTVTSQTKSSSPSPCTNLFGVSIQTITKDLKGKSVKSPTTHDFLMGPTWAADLSEASTSARPKQLQEKLKCDNYYYGTGTYSDWSEEELDCLWIGVRRYGTNSWYAILNDPLFRFSKMKSFEDLAKRWEVEQRKLFSCPVPVPVPVPPPYTGSRYSGSVTDLSLGYNNISSRYLHNSHDFFAHDMLYASYNHRRAGRAKYQTRRAPKAAQKLTHAPSPSTNNTNNNNNYYINNNNELPHWLREMIEAPAKPTSGLKRKASGDELNPNDLLDLNKKTTVPNPVPVPIGPNNLVVIDSDDASSDETISE